ncbi:MAG: nucleoside-diphosphate kinase [Candidatus Wildermuthbacteria bacterium]|nr:nucleoside-diphosphate kinase [Candidatus Wildermuthbacteria bacterium]MBI2121110.1 nucleoside-diphosphate kinase [Candidatus Wildermuthbacteria bacterium]
MADLKEEKTCVIIKPDGVKRGLVGECVKRIEQRGLKLIALKMIVPTEEKAKGHYPGSKEWLMGMGEKSLDTYRKYGKDPIAELGTDDTLVIGNMIYGWLVRYLTEGPMVAMAVSGIHAIDMVRKIVGKTIPAFAEMGTIRGDYSVDSPVLANDGKRAIHNLIHASGDPSEAEHEIAYWFAPDELHAYKRAEEDIMF